jgi:predicted alpha-1,2-mannosidase
VSSALSRRRFLGASAVGAASLWLKPVVGEGESAGVAAVNRSQSINPLIGASTSTALGEGKTFPGPATPFGMVQLGPDTITGGDNAPGYSYEHTTIEGFSFTRMSGVGWYGDFGNLLMMPTTSQTKAGQTNTGPMKLACGRAGHEGEGWRSRFRHATERAEANYYAIDLDDYGIRAELTAAPRSGMLLFTYPQAEQSRIQIDLARRIGGTSTRQYVKVVGDQTGEQAIEGWMRCPKSGGGWGNGAGDVSYTVYFRVEFSKPLARYGVWTIDVPEGMFPVKAGLTTDYFESDGYYELVKQGKVLDGCREMEAAHLGFFAEFPTHAAEQVMVKAGISFVSMDGARKNLAQDIPGWDFAEVHRRGRAQWDEVLGKIEIEGASKNQEGIFATALYHAMIDPRAISDVDGKYTGADGKIHTAKDYTPRTIFSGWDVFRAEFPLMTLLDPAVVNDQINSLLELAQLSSKGYLERWEIMNAYSGCMDGDPAIAVIVDAYNKGIRRYDIEKAYAACRQTAAGTGSATNRPENEFYLEHGYVPKLVSWTLDNVYYDWCVANFAASLGKTEDARTFTARAANYKKIYDPQVGSMRARDADGKWIPWEGKTAFGQGCTESNPGQQTWFVPHDVAGLIELMGGAEEFAKQLDAFFEKTPPSFGWNEYYNHSNEPVHHVAYLFTYAGKPWLTQKWVRRILAAAYRNEVNGIVGNDDVGQMSAWYVLSAMGFYPVCPGDNTYVLGSPLFSKVTLRLDRKWHKGQSFTIVAANQSEDNVYVQSSKLNGRPLSRAWIRHSEIVAGGTLEFVMGAAPNEKWGVHELPSSMSGAKEKIPEA